MHCWLRHKIYSHKASDRAHRFAIIVWKHRTTNCYTKLKSSDFTFVQNSTFYSSKAHWQIAFFRLKICCCLEATWFITNKMNSEALTTRVWKRSLLAIRSLFVYISYVLLLYFLLSISVVNKVLLYGMVLQPMQIFPTSTVLPLLLHLPLQN